ncbi:MAG: hypothetical protein IPK19_13515 [Chloroflexi bacterium]|nr:hypothetical protein [Chloroflexota bacterium]
MLVLVLLVAVAGRVAALALFTDVFAFDQTGTIHGSEAYDTYARNLLTTNIYGITPGVPDALIPPLYSYALSVIYAAFGRGYWQVGGFHIVLDLISMVMLYAIVVRVVRTSVRTNAAAEWVATLSVAFYAFYPYLIFQNLTLIDTPFFMTLMHAFVLAVVLLREEPRLDSPTVLLAILAGFALGLATLSRPILPVLAVFVALWFLFRLSLWQTILRLGVVAVISVLVLIPWIIRNQDVYGGAFVPMSVTSGSNLWQGNSPYTIPYLQAGYDVQWTSPNLTAQDLDSPQADQERMQQVFAFWRDNPDLLPELFWTKFLVHWSIDIAPRLNPTSGELPRLEGQPDVEATTGEAGELALGGLPPGDPVDAYAQPLFDQLGRTLHRFYFGGLLALAVIGFLFSLRGWRDASLMWFVQIAMTAVYVLFHPSTRYRVPSDPLLFVLSALALVTVWMWLFGRPPRSPRPPRARAPRRPRDPLDRPPESGDRGPAPRDSGWDDPLTGRSRPGGWEERDPLARDLRDRGSRRSRGGRRRTRSILAESPRRR